MFYEATLILPRRWGPLLATESRPGDTPRAPARDDERTLVVNFAGAADCVWADVRLASGGESYHLEAVLFDDGHGVDSMTFAGDDGGVLLNDGGDLYLIRTEWEDGG